MGHAHAREERNHMSAHDITPVSAENKSLSDIINRPISAATMPWLVFPRSFMELAASVGITLVGWAIVGVVIAATH
jgi:hypothetical protein